jgi:hypothetical protein
MSVTNLNAQRVAISGDADPGARIAALESEVRLLREEFAKMRDLILDREKSGRTLINAYKEVIADFTDLFEAQRRDNVKRDESLRFFLNSIEGRIREDIRAELGAGAESAAAARGIWPFRRRR